MIRERKVIEWCCPDCDYRSEVLLGNRRCRPFSGDGSPNSHGTPGAPGPSTAVLDLMARPQGVVSSTPDDGSNTFQGHLRAILSQLSGDEVGEFTLMVSFDLETYSRLSARLFGPRGRPGMDAAEFSLTIVHEEPRST